MALINYFKKEIHVKVVYCGPGLSGKTSNLQWLNQNFSEGKVGKLISLATKTDRTLFFDLLPVSLGKIRNLETRIQLFTTPGQVFYNSTRKLVLKGVDGIVFVADSQKPMKSANIESLNNIIENLKDYDRDISEIPLVMQYNKRDLTEIMSTAELEADLNPNKVPFVEACAIDGSGVVETFEAISKATFAKLLEQERGKLDPAAAAPPPTKAESFATPSETPNNAPPAAISPPSPRPAGPTDVNLTILSCGTPEVISAHEVRLPLMVSLGADQEPANLSITLNLEWGKK